MWRIVALLVATMAVQVLAAENEDMDVKRLQQQVSRMEQQMEDMQQQWLAEKKQLKEEINKLTHHIEQNNRFQNKAEILFGKVMHDNQNLRHLVENSATQHKHDSVIGFSAYASVTRGYDAGAIVQFDSVITNEGGFYSDQTSTFTCISTGYYLFSINVQTGGGITMRADIEIGGDAVVSVWANDYSDSGSNTVIASCPQGKQVYVRCTGNSNTMAGDPLAPMSMFTGILLYSA